MATEPTPSSAIAEYAASTQSPAVSLPDLFADPTCFMDRVLPYRGVLTRRPAPLPYSGVWSDIREAERDAQAVWSAVDCDWGAGNPVRPRVPLLAAHRHRGRGILQRG